MVLQPFGQLVRLQKWQLLSRPGRQQELVRGEMAYEEQDEDSGFRFDSAWVVVGCSVDYSTVGRAFNLCSGSSGAGAFKICGHNHGHRRQYAHG
jgi:hypothetical protein